MCIYTYTSYWYNKVVDEDRTRLYDYMDICIIVTNITELPHNYFR